MKIIKTIVLSLILGCGLLQCSEQKPNAPAPTVHPLSMKEKVIEGCLRTVPVVAPIVGGSLISSNNGLYTTLGYAVLAATGVFDYWVVKNFVPSKGVASVIFSVMLAGPVASRYLTQSPSSFNQRVGSALRVVAGLIDVGYMVDVVLS
jgi:hypothetical protein